MRLASFPPYREPYREVPQPGNTTFLAIAPGQFSTVHRLAKACRSTLTQSNKGQIADNHHESYEMLSPSLFIIRWRSIKTARLFEDKIVKVALQDILVQPYPEQAPQLFVTHMDHNGSHGVRIDAIHSCISHAVPDYRFHLRHEEIGDARDTVWIVVFEAAPNLLRFTVGIQHHGNDHHIVAFEPLMATAACPVCHRGHSALGCDMLVRAGRKELKVKKSNASYLSKVPDIK